jgi:hypothetical protein
MARSDERACPPCQAEQQEVCMTRCLSSLARLLILTLAIMIVPVAAQTPTLAPNVLTKLLDYIARVGNDREVPADIAKRLGLSAAGQVWSSRQAGLKETESGILHGVYASRGRENDLLLTLTSAAKDRVDIYRIRRDGILVAAASMDLQKHQFIERDRAATQKGLDAELVFWTNAKSLE